MSIFDININAWYEGMKRLDLSRNIDYQQNKLKFSSFKEHKLVDWNRKFGNEGSSTIDSYYRK